MPALEIEALRVSYATPAGADLAVVHDVSLAVEAGRGHGIVGESGAGKSQLALAVMGLLPDGARRGGEVRLSGERLDPASAAAWRGDRVAMVFQDPMSALNPHLTVGRQLAEVLEVHRDADAAQARRAAAEALRTVHLPDADRLLDRYPHQMSGGMRQRVLIAMALLCDPAVLIADEPTTALDVTVQAGILELLDELRRERGIALLLITHDLGVVARLCDEVSVMYAGRVVESGPTPGLLANPCHPYTRGLLDAVPDLGGRRAALRGIPGQPPPAGEAAPGCAFAPRCQHAFDRCLAERPSLEARPAGRAAACHLDSLP